MDYPNLQSDTSTDQAFLLVSCHRRHIFQGACQQACNMSQTQYPITGENLHSWNSGPPFHWRGANDGTQGLESGDARGVTSNSHWHVEIIQ